VVVAKQRENMLRGEEGGQTIVDRVRPSPCLCDCPGTFRTRSDDGQRTGLASPLLQEFVHSLWVMCKEFSYQQQQVTAFQAYSYGAVTLTRRRARNSTDLVPPLGSGDGVFCFNLERTASSSIGYKKHLPKHLIIHCTEWFQSASDLQVHIHCARALGGIRCSAYPSSVLVIRISIDGLGARVTVA
jgi:hypothetical protein